MQFESSIEEGIVSSEIAVSLYKQGKDKWNNWMETDFCHLSTVPTLTLDNAFVGSSFDGFVFKCDVVVAEKVRNPTFIGAVFHGKLTISPSSQGPSSFDFQSAIFLEDVSFCRNIVTLNLISSQFHKMLHLMVNTEIRTLLLQKCIFRRGLNINAIKIHQDIEASEMKCHGEFSFNRTTVGGNSSFKNSVFSQRVWVYANSFEQMVSFDNCTFHNTAQFLSCSYAQTVHFENSTFSMVPEFFQSNISPESVAGIVVKYSRDPKRYKWIFHRASRFEDAQAYRQLKQMAVTRQDHAAEQRYFAQEMRAKRWHEETHIANLSINYLYEMVSNYGQSILRPFILLWAVVFLHTNLYLQTSPINNWTLAVYYSLSNSLPFGSLTRRSQSLYDQLYPKGIEAYPEQLTLFYATIGLNGFFGFVFLFLIGLGLRNQFRL
jgi:hypothetical protein